MLKEGTYNADMQLAIEKSEQDPLIVDKLYKLEFSVKITENFNDKSLLKPFLKTFTYFVDAPDIDIEGTPDVRLSFNEEKVAVSEFRIIPRKEGLTKIAVDLLQNHTFVATAETELEVSQPK
ncbi:MAG: hypothetical protein KDJ35_08175 [Alphaproteobacteria bacterium]|nr:hypothetical protein [Alphaproteobacteria bacterium]